MKRKRIKTHEAIQILRDCRADVVEVSGDLLYVTHYTRVIGWITIENGQVDREKVSEAIRKIGEYG